MECKYNWQWWQLALAAAAVSATGGLSSLQSHRKDKTVYQDKLRQAPWAPAPWLFGPAWILNNYFLLHALQKILNEQPPGYKDLLKLQAGIWVIYFSFGYIYFNKKSPVLASLWTVTDFLLAAYSSIKTFRNSKNITADYLPLVAWTSFASSIALYQAFYNKDPYLQKIFKKQGTGN